ncbi:MAG: hypothetical protein M3P24_12135 [Gemmatimonadota bacterium]|nr:hypothetical protein [Gemmatimonadota bacterium]
MKKFLLSLAALGIVAIPATGHAQSSTTPQTATISASANVASVVSVSGTQNLRFGSGAANEGLLPGATYTVNVSTGVGGTRGRATVEHNTPVTVSITKTADLVNSDATLGAADMPFSVTCGDTDSGLTAVSTTGWGTCSKTVALTSGKKTTSYLVVGGSLTVPADQAAGSYTGQVTFSAAFTRY